jgi:penicillin-binding protein 2D
MRLLANFMRHFGYLLLAFTSMSILGLVIFIAITINTIPVVPDELNQLIAVPPTEVYAADGSLITRVGGRKSIPFERMPKTYLNSVLAAEDDDFYNHGGIDKKALLRAIYGVLSGASSGGGSSITQQLAKNLFFTFDQTYDRKFKEILVTLEIEERFAKDEIFGSYCNGIYFGNFAFGVEEAATSYFGKHASNLTLAESSLLAGLPQSPSRFNPYKAEHKAVARQKWILGRLEQLKLINNDQHNKALEEELKFQPLYASADEGSYFLDAIINHIDTKYGSSVLYHGGLKIYSTLDPMLQRYATQAVNDGLVELDKRFSAVPFDADNRKNVSEYPQAALVSIEASTGAIQALVGGRDWKASQYNRVLSTNRNMGSVLKPVLYLTGVEKLKLSPASLVMDSSITIEIPGTNPWSPLNYDPFFRGQILLKDALEHSVNTVAARIILATTPQSMVSTLERMGVQSPVSPHYSIALGGASITTIELAGIGACLANLGETVEPFFIRRIEDERGIILEEHIVRKTPVFDPEDVYQVVDMMQGVAKEGTGRGIHRYGFTVPSIVKTGTTNDYRDSWFFGATPRLATSVWVGFDDNRQMRDLNNYGITGASGALPLWARFMAKATEGEPPRDFPVPAGMYSLNVNRKTGEIVELSSDSTIQVTVRGESLLPDSTMLHFEAAWLDSLYGDRDEIPDSLKIVSLDSLGQLSDSLEIDTLSGRGNLLENETTASDSVEMIQ